MRTALLRRQSSIAAILALTIIGASAAVVRSHAFAANPDVAAWGITFDLTLSLPLLYWFFVVRKGHARALTILPVFLGGTIAAALLLPEAQQQFVRQVERLAVPLAELALLTALALRVRAAAASDRADQDALTRIRAAARAITGNDRAGELVASEIAMLYYALFGWRMKPLRDDRNSFTVHERSGWSTVLVCIFVLIVAEGLGMHLLLGRWSTLAAWSWTALDLWAMAWFLGDYHALRVRRSFVDDDALHLRYGMRWSLDVPLAAITSIEAVREERAWKQPGILKVAMLEEPRWLITFDEPRVASGLAGLRKTVHAIALLPDDERWIEILRDQWRIARARDGR